MDCCICHGVLEASKWTLATIEYLVKFLIVKVNYKLLEESSICETCLRKIQSAYKFKTSYLDVLQKTLTDVTVNEESDLKKCIKCEICKTTNQSGCIPLFDSVTKSGFNLIRYLSAKLESRIQENSVTCETCHKSLINFYDITNSLTFFNEDCIKELDNAMNIKEIQEIDKDLNSTNSGRALKDSFKVEMNSPVDLKKEEILDNSHDEFVLKSEEVDIKMDCDDSQLTRQHNGNEVTASTSILNQTNYKSENESCPVTANQTENVSTEMFKCQNCEYLTNRKSNLNRHILIHKSSEDVEINKCRNCEFKTKYKASLKKHMLVHSDEVEMSKCPHCEFKTKRKDGLREHLQFIHANVSNSEIFTCEICTYESVKKDNLEKHMLVHRNPDEVKIFKCQICEFKSKRKDGLKKHMLVHQNSDEVEMIECEICDFKTKRKDGLKQHMLVHMSTDEVEMYKCQICEYQTKRKNGLKKHMLTHKNSDETEMFKCQICEFNTKHRDGLKKHMIVHQNSDEVEMFKCEICDYHTKHKDGLKKHMLVHMNSNKIDMFKCQICKFKTKRKHCLKEHMHHIHKKPDELEMFKCKICEFKTKYKSTLKKHVLVHKNPNEIKMFKCQLCTYQTKYKYGLPKHMILHKNSDEVEMFKCQYCKYETKFKNAVKRHIHRIHQNSDTDKTRHQNKNEVAEITSHTTDPKIEVSTITSSQVPHTCATIPIPTERENPKFRHCSWIADNLLKHPDPREWPAELLTVLKRMRPPGVTCRIRKCFRATNGQNVRVMIPNSDNVNEKAEAISPLKHTALETVGSILPPSRRLQEALASHTTNPKNDVSTITLSQVPSTCASITATTKREDASIEMHSPEIQQNIWIADTLLQHPNPRQWPAELVTTLKRMHPPGVTQRIQKCFRSTDGRRVRINLPITDNVNIAISPLKHTAMDKVRNTLAATHSEVLKNEVSSITLSQVPKTCTIIASPTKQEEALGPQTTDPKNDVSSVNLSQVTTTCAIIASPTKREEALGPHDTDPKNDVSTITLPQIPSTCASIASTTKREDAEMYRQKMQQYSWIADTLLQHPDPQQWPAELVTVLKRMRPPGVTKRIRKCFRATNGRNVRIILPNSDNINEAAEAISPLKHYTAMGTVRNTLAATHQEVLKNEVSSITLSQVPTTCAIIASPTKREEVLGPHDTDPKNEVSSVTLSQVTTTCAIIASPTKREEALDPYTTDPKNEVSSITLSQVPTTCAMIASPTKREESVGPYDTDPKNEVSSVTLSQVPTTCTLIASPTKQEEALGLHTTDPKNEVSSTLSQVPTTCAIIASPTKREETVGPYDTDPKNKVSSVTLSPVPTTCAIIGSATKREEALSPHDTDPKNEVSTITLPQIASTCASIAPTTKQEDAEMYRQKMQQYSWIADTLLQHPDPQQWPAELVTVLKRMRPPGVTKRIRKCFRATNGRNVRIILPNSDNINEAAEAISPLKHTAMGTVRDTLAATHQEVLKNEVSSITMSPIPTTCAIIASPTKQEEALGLHTTDPKNEVFSTLSQVQSPCAVMASPTEREETLCPRTTNPKNEMSSVPLSQVQSPCAVMASPTEREETLGPHTTDPKNEVSSNLSQVLPPCAIIVSPTERENVEMHNPEFRPEN